MEMRFLIQWIIIFALSGPLFAVGEDCSPEEWIQLGRAIESRNRELGNSVQQDVIEEYSRRNQEISKLLQDQSDVVQVILDSSANKRNLSIATRGLRTAIQAIPGGTNPELTRLLVALNALAKELSKNGTANSVREGANYKNVIEFFSRTKEFRSKGGLLALYEDVLSGLKHLRDSDAEMVRSIEELIELVAKTEGPSGNFRFLYSIDHSLISLRNSSVGGPEYIEALKQLKRKLSYLQFTRAIEYGKDGLPMAGDRDRQLRLLASSLSDDGIENEGIEKLIRDSQACVEYTTNVCQLDWHNLDFAVDRAREKKDMNDKILAVSEGYMGVRYVGGGGVGDGVSAPIVCTHAADCWRFLEQVIGIVRSRSSDEVASNVSLIRMGANEKTMLQPAGHFPSPWIARMIDNGILKDATANIANLSGIDIKQVSGTVDFPEFARRNLLKQEDDVGIEAVSRFEPQKFSAPYLPYQDLLADPEAMKKIPSGTLVSVVVDPNKWKIGDKLFREVVGSDILMSHHGIIVHRDGEVFIRHAGTTGVHEAVGGQVMEEPLMHYLRNRVATSPERVGLRFLEALPAGD